jgi:hypothetical protein
LGATLRPVLRAGFLGIFFAIFPVTRLTAFFAFRLLDFAAAFFFAFARFTFPPFDNRRGESKSGVLPDIGSDAQRYSPCAIVRPYTDIGSDCHSTTGTTAGRSIHPATGS